MKLNLTFLFTWILFCWQGVLSVSAQNFSKIDSLKALLVSEKSDDLIYSYLDQISDEYAYFNVDSCVKYADILLYRAQMNADTLWMAEAEKGIGNSYCIAGDLSKALVHSVRSEKFFNEIHNVEGKNVVVQNIGSIYSMLGDYDKAIEHYLEVLPYFESKKNLKDLANCYFNIVLGYINTHQFEKAQKYLRKFENIKEVANEQLGMEYLKADLFLQQGKLDSAVYYFKLDYQSAKKSLNTYSENLALIGLGSTYLKLSDYATALNYYDLAEQLSVKNNYVRDLDRIYLARTTIYDSIKNYKAAYMEMTKLKAIEDLIFENEKNDKLSELKIKYESEKQELEIAKQRDTIAQAAALRHEKETRNIILFTAIGFVLISLLINTYFKRQRRKELEKQKLYIEKQKEKIVGSINYAKRIQDSILKPKGEISEIFPSSFVFFKPKAIVSGDFYWFKEFGDKKVVATVDCIGHGVPGAFMSLIVNNLLEKHVTSDRLFDPGDILNRLHEELLNESSLGTAYKGMDMSLCVIHEKDRSLCFAGARNSAYIYNQGNFTKLAADPFSIGAETTIKTSFKTYRYNLKENDKLYMYTDGFVDQFGGEKMKKFNIPKFKKMIQELENVNFDRVNMYINKCLQDWQGSLAQTDDILIFGVKLL